jgi:hypothetical protein
MSCRRCLELQTAYRAAAAALAANPGDPRRLEKANETANRLIRHEQICPSAQDAMSRHALTGE